jgi:Xaa-Pro dipeptidase
MMETTPAAEIKGRVAVLKESLAKEGLSLALIRQAADLFYYTGVLVDGFLAVAPEGEPLLLVRRPQSRIQEAAAPWPLARYRDVKELPALLSKGGLPSQGAVGLELDVMPALFYQRLQEQVFPQQPIQDLSPLVRRQRMVKSAYEIQQLRRAAAILDRVHQTAPELLKPGLTELELSAALEYRLRVLGHEGLVRVRNWDLEIHYGHVLSGVSGLAPAYTDTPSGGPGISQAFPQGPSLKPLAAGEPISIDLAACSHGYVVDMTRMYALGELPPPAWEAWRLVEELYRIFESEARPGVMPGKIFHRLWDLVKSRGFQEIFMGPGPERVAFLGHGVGLELDEFPFISNRFPYPLEADMVLAFEPKFFLPEIGMVGLEDTGRITPDGVEWLTRSPREIIIV